jgi:phasin family protein
MTTPKESIEVLNDLSSKGYEAAKSLGEINLRIMERMMARQLDTFNLVMDSGLRNIKMITEAKGPNDLVRGQMDLVREVSERLLAESRESVKLASDTREEYRAWVEQGVQIVTEKMGKFRPVV